MESINTETATQAHNGFWDSVMSHCSHEQPYITIKAPKSVPQATSADSPRTKKHYPPRVYFPVQLGDKIISLTSKQYRVLTLLNLHQTAQEMANILEINKRTFEFHLSKIYEKVRDAGIVFKGKKALLELLNQGGAADE